MQVADTGIPIECWGVLNKLCQTSILSIYYFTSRFDTVYLTLPFERVLSTETLHARYHHQFQCVELIFLLYQV